MCLCVRSHYSSSLSSAQERERDLVGLRLKAKFAVQTNKSIIDVKGGGGGLKVDGGSGWV